MAGICCGVVGEGETTTLSPIDPTSRPSRRRRLDPVPLRYIADMAVSPPEGARKIQKRDICDTPVRSRESISAVENSDEVIVPVNSKTTGLENEIIKDCPKFGVTSVCGRRRDMEDAVSVHPTFCQEQQDLNQTGRGSHFFGVFDGHGCSHVNTRIRRFYIIIPFPWFSTRSGSYFGVNFYFYR